jgi:hypothetical protein
MKQLRYEVYYSLMFCHHLVFCLTMLIFFWHITFFRRLANLKLWAALRSPGSPITLVISTCLVIYSMISGDLCFIQSAPLVFWVDGRSARWVHACFHCCSDQAGNYPNNSMVNFLQSLPICYDNFASIGSHWWWRGLISNLYHALTHSQHIGWEGQVMKILDNSLLQMGGGLCIYQSSRLTLFQKCFCCHLHWNSEEYDQLLKSPELTTTIQKTSYSWLLLVLRFWVSILTLTNLRILHNFCHWKQSLLGKSWCTFDIGKCSMSRIFWRWF